MHSSLLEPLESSTCNAEICMVELPQVATNIQIIPKRIRDWVTDHQLGYMIGTQQDSSPTWRNVNYCKDRAVRWCFDRKDPNRRKLLSSVVGILEAARIQRHSACGIRDRMNNPWIIASSSSQLLRILIPWIGFPSNGATRCSIC